jgi:hypothetical protein
LIKSGTRVKASPKFMKRQYFGGETVTAITWAENVIVGHTIAVCRKDTFKGMASSFQGI